MKKILFFEYLPILSFKEMDELVELAHLKRFRLEALEITLLKSIIESFKKDGIAVLNKTSLSNFVGGEDFNWNNALKKYLAVIRSYIQFVQVESDPIESGLQRGLYFKSKLGYKYARKEFENGLRKLDKQVSRGIEYYHNKYRFYFQKYDISGFFNNNILLGGFTEMNDYLDRHYVLCKLLIASEVRNMKEFQSQSIEIWNEKEVDAKAEAFNAKDQNPVFTLLANIKRIRNFDQEEKLDDYTLSLYDRLFQEFKSNYHLVEGTKEGKQTFVHLSNFCIAQQRRGKENYLAKRFELMLFGLDTGALMKDGRISQTSFWNIIIAAIKLNKFDEAKKLLTNYADRVDQTTDKESFLMFCKAQINFFEHNYVAALADALKIRFTNPTFRIMQRILELKCHFELSQNNGDGLNFLITQIENFNRNTKSIKSVSIFLRQNYLNFGRILRKIVWAKIRQDFTPNKQKKWLAELQNTKNINSKLWLKDILTRSN